LKDYIYKLLKVYLGTEHLLQFAASHKRRHFFERVLGLVFLDSRAHDVSFDLSTSPTRKLKELWQEFRISGKEVYRGRPHAECTILAYLLQNDIDNVFPTVGISRASCIGCKVYFEAFRKAIRIVGLRFFLILFISATVTFFLQKEFSVNKNMATLGGKNKTQALYARPLLPNRLAELDDTICSYMEEELKDEVLLRWELLHDDDVYKDEFFVG